MLRIKALKIVFVFLFLQAQTGLIFSQVDKTKEIDKVLNDFYSSGKFQGSVLIGNDNGIVYEKGFGYSNIEYSVPNTPQTKFRIASLTKAFTSLLVMQQVQEGKIKLDARITDYIPDYPAKTGSKITIQHLLSHTSGLGHYEVIPGFFQYNSYLPYKHTDFIKLFWNQPLLSEPGTKFRYSSLGYYILGVILEKVTGKTYEELLNERILDKLGMKYTSIDNHKRIEMNRANGYEKTGNGYLNAAYRNMTTALATGDILSTVGDLYLWDRALYTNKLVSFKTRDMIFTPNKDSYGYGWSIYNIVLPDGERTRVASHTGTTSGFLSIITRYIDKHTVIILLCNSDKSDTEGITEALKNIIFDNPQLVKKGQATP
ncbi:MAG: serine hydrolase domain-containing protein [Ignavibacteriales bacterium]